MGKLINLVGMKFGRLTVISYAGKTTQRDSLWAVVCECGTEKLVRGIALRHGNTKSCGCLQREAASNAHIKHGFNKRGQQRSEYRIWKLMKYRCTKDTDKNWHNYGGRGITVCDSWLNSFEAFLSDMGERPKGTSLDRIDVNGNYEPGNCRWATAEDQGNNKRTSRYVEHNGEKLTLSQWARKIGVPYETLVNRANYGWPVDLILSKESHTHLPRQKKSDRIF